MTAATAALTPPAPDPVQLRLPPPPGYCTKRCGTRLSVANVDGVCDGCHDEAAAKLRRARAGVKFCRACGGEYFKNGYCVDHYRQYHQDAYQRRKAQP